MLEYLSYIFGFIAASGGLSGIVTSWYYWKRFKKKIEVIPLGSCYKVGEVVVYDATCDAAEFKSNESLDKLLVELNFLVINDSEISISITDALALMKYSKSKIRVNIGYPKGVIVAKPALANKLPIIIQPHSSKKIKLEFNFKNIKLNLIERCGYAYFMGWLNGVPTFFMSEIEKERKWDSLPLDVRLVLHIDAKVKKIIDFCVLNDKQFKEEYMGSGTLGLVDTERAKKEFWESKLKDEV